MYRNIRYGVKPRGFPVWAEVLCFVLLRILVSELNWFTMKRKHSFSSWRRGLHHTRRRTNDPRGLWNRFVALRLLCISINDGPRRPQPPSHGPAKGCLLVTGGVTEPRDYRTTDLDVVVGVTISTEEQEVYRTLQNKLESAGQRARSHGNA